MASFDGAVRQYYISYFPSLSKLCLLYGWRKYLESMEEKNQDAKKRGKLNVGR